MKKSNKLKKHRDTISVFIKEDCEEEVLEWINSQKYISGAILDVIRMYVLQLKETEKTQQFLDINNLNTYSIPFPKKTYVNIAEEKVNANAIEEEIIVASPIQDNIEIETNNEVFTEKKVTNKKGVLNGFKRTSATKIGD